MSSCSTEGLVLTGLITIQSHMTTGCCNLLNLTKIDRYKMFILSLSYRPSYTVLLLRIKYGIVNSLAALLLLKWLPPEWMKSGYCCLTRMMWRNFSIKMSAEIHQNLCLLSSNKRWRRVYKQLGSYKTTLDIIIISPCKSPQNSPKQSPLWNGSWMACTMHSWPIQVIVKPPPRRICQ